MRFRVLKQTAKGNLVLEGDGAPVERRTTLYSGGKEAAVIFDTIASVDKPLYLAQKKSEGELIGKTLSTREAR
ncbi:hypothetical protein COU36_01820 [Candidatus Micrarchaeota archaeon CG10_big_fil_rev_8_21_14_0_10_59_7]|nr:MAG: hypothetical protein COU36_01820 [Candidatus Micrarchaeota archaeon CG10_big_fil_rev_8_21_14_0_10_59_7]